jgi:hypothetical protein
MPGSTLGLLRRPARLVNRLRRARGAAVALLVAGATASAMIVPVAAQASATPRGAAGSSRVAPFVSFPAFCQV